MQINTLAINYLITPFENHKIVKDDILKILDSDPGRAINNNRDKISKCDYSAKEFTSLYVNKLIPFLMPCLTKIYKYLEHDDAILDNMWYQQYTHNDNHNWHQHRSSSWANVYYLELPIECPGTILKNPATKELIVPDVKEGDILTFPSIVWHCSPKNTSFKRKTSIAFNIK